MVDSSTNIEAILRAPTNNSTAKTTYSFSKDVRFKDLSNKLQNQNIGYNLPSTMRKSEISFGVSDRKVFKISKSKGQSPNPTTYNLPSQFENTNKKGKTYSFGAPRRSYDKVYNEKKPFLEQNNPGPGHYKIPTKIGDNNSKKISMHARIATVKDNQLKASRKIPGPGQYALNNALINKTGSYVQSQFQNTCTPSFRLPTKQTGHRRGSNGCAIIAPLHSSRTIHPNKSIQELSSAIVPAAASSIHQGNLTSRGAIKSRAADQLTVNLLPDDKPGPGTYDPKDTCFGRKRNSSSIYNTDRKLTMEDITKKNLPGPGEYRLPSDFGYVNYRKNRKMKTVKKFSRNNGNPRGLTHLGSFSKSASTKLFIHQANATSTSIIVPYDQAVNKENTTQQIQKPQITTELEPINNQSQV